MRMSLKQSMDLYLMEREPFIKEKTYTYYNSNFDYFVRYLNEELEIDCDELDISDFSHLYYNRYVASLRKRTNKTLRDGSERKLSTATIHNYTLPIKVLFKFLYESEYLEKDISRRMANVKINKKILMPLFKSEIEQIDSLQNPKSFRGLRNLCLIHLMLDVGMRISEALNLKIEDVYFDKKFIHIKESKFSKDRLVPMPSNLKTMLYKYIHFYRFDADHTYVLQNKVGDKYEYEAAKNIVRRIKLKLEMPKLKNHLFRHTFATSYILCGGDVASLAVVMGHEDISTTNGYLHLANTYRLMGKDDIYKVDKIFTQRLSPV